MTASTSTIFTDPAPAALAASRAPRPICFRPARAAAKKQCQFAARRRRISISCLLSRWNAASVGADTAGRRRAGRVAPTPPRGAAPAPAQLRQTDVTSGSTPGRRDAREATQTKTTHV